MIAQATPGAPLLPSQLIDEQLVYRFDRLDSIDGWWAWALILGVIGFGLWGVIRWYRRDAAELARPISRSLILLRVFAIACLVLFFMQPERRTRQRVGRPSETVVIVDSSQSMSLPVDDQSSDISRMDAASQLLKESPLLNDLASQHRLTVYATGNGDEPQELAAKGPLQPLSQLATASASSVPNPAGVTTVRRVFVWLGTLGILIAFALLVRAGWFAWRQGVDAAARPVFLGVVLAIISGTMVASCAAIAANASLAALWGLSPTEESGETSKESPAPASIETPSLDLAADGGRSLLGDSLQWVSRRHDPATLAGIVLLTDGQNNGGISLDAAARQMGRLGVPVYSIGLGSSRPPGNVRVVDLEAPPRVYPGDKFSISTTLQGTGISNQTVEVQLLDGLDNEPWQPLSLETRKVELPADGQPIELSFELAPESVGRRQLGIRVAPQPGEANEQDNQLAVRYEVVTRRLRVLIIAGGPMREYQFVRNLLHRDREITLDVWLQSGQEGMSQESNQLLSGFPTTPEELFEYDVILAFDPDWDQLTTAQVELLDRWVAEQAGGLAFIAGPVFTPRLAVSRTEQKSTIRDLLPVVLAGRSLSIEEGRYAGEEPWAIHWTDEGSRTEFLRPVDEVVGSREVWDKFSGFYGYFAVREPKPGATVYANFSDPTTAVDGQLPVLMASQFFGAGRSFFLGSGELWRLRSEGDAYFDRIYTKLVRWAAEGRLLRDSNRGVLLVDPPRAVVGDSITIRAVLLNDQFQPLEVPEVEAQILEPGRGVRTLKLQRLQGQPRGGTYGGQFIARAGGQFEVRIEVGDPTNRQVLRDSVQVRMPTLELERPRRNDEDLKSLASLSNGKFVAWEELSANRSGAAAMSQQVTGWLTPKTQETVLPGTPDRDFQRRRNAGVMWLVAGALILEWVLRRLNRLA